MKNIFLFIILLFSTISCKDNVEREKDKHPEIPEFPLLYKDQLVYKKLDVIKVSFKETSSNNANGDDLSIFAEDYFFYTVTNNALIIITGYRKAVEAGKEFPATNYITVTRVKNDTIEKRVLKEISYNNIDIFGTDKQLRIGNRKIDLNSQNLIVKTDSSNYQNIPEEKTNIQTWPFDSDDIDKTELHRIYDIASVKETDRANISSKLKMSKIANFNYVAVPLIYYKFYSNGKTAFSKINFEEQKPPLFVRIKDKIYCISYSDLSTPDRRLFNYEIGVLQ